jgi:hypothetical protein
VRVKEATKLGFEQVVMPAGAGRGGPSASGNGLRIREIRRLSELNDLLDSGEAALDPGFGD